MPVSLKAVADELQIQNEESTVYINRRTGELYTVAHEEMRMAESENLEDDDLPEWQVATVAKAREILDSDDWSFLPSKFTIHEWDIMRRFGASIGSTEASEQIDRAIHGRGAFRMFRNTVERFGLLERWYQFRDDAFLQIARTALEEIGVPFEPPDA